MVPRSKTLKNGGKGKNTSKMVRLQWNLMKLGKNPSQYRFGHDSGGPEAAGGQSKPKRGKRYFRYRRPGRGPYML